jgi:hypothetical protein
MPFAPWLDATFLIKALRAVSLHFGLGFGVGFSVYCLTLTISNCFGPPPVTACSIRRYSFCLALSAAIASHVLQDRFFGSF